LHERWPRLEIIWRPHTTAAAAAETTLASLIGPAGTALALLASETANVPSQDTKDSTGSHSVSPAARTTPSLLPTAPASSSSWTTPAPASGGPLVTVIVPCDLTTTEQQLIRALQSVRVQSFPDWELLVVGSNCPVLAAVFGETGLPTDGQWLMLDKRVRWWNLGPPLPCDQVDCGDRTSCRGQQQACNYALKMVAHTPFVAYLTPDCVWRPMHLAVALGALVSSCSLHHPVGNRLSSMADGPRPMTTIAAVGTQSDDLRHGDSDCSCRWVLTRHTADVEEERPKTCNRCIVSSGLVHGLALVRGHGYWPQFGSVVCIGEAWPMAFASLPDVTVVVKDSSSG